MKTIPDFSDISITPSIIDCNVQRCCALLVPEQQNVVALIQGILPYKAKEQQISIRIFPLSSLNIYSGFRRSIHFAFKGRYDSRLLLLFDSGGKVCLKRAGR